MTTKKVNTTIEFYILELQIMDIIFSDFLILSPQVKRSVIITNKHSIYELTHELTNDLRVKTQDPRKLGKISKISKLYRIIT